MPLAVYLLSFCNALMFICSSMLITVSALIGYELADTKILATLPLGIQYLAMMCSTIPASLLMARIGRKYSFMLAALIGLAGALTALFSVITANFWTFCAATFCFGTFSAFGNYYRFTAAEVVDESRKSLSISYVMAGGVVAAFIGPNLASWSQALVEGHRYAGAFVVLVAVYLLSLAVVSQADLPKPPPRGIKKSGRPLTEIMLQPVFIVAVMCEMFGYGTMNLVMTSTPLAMNLVDHGLAETAFVIQWHVVAMFLPSFFTGHLIKRVGVVPVLATGALLGLISVGINLNGTSVVHFTAGLVSLGVCWNFLFVGGTTLLTDAHTPDEKARTQAANDFIVFSTVAMTALCAGGIHHLFGWQVVNWSVVPLLLLAALAILWLHLSKRHLSPKLS